MAQIKPILSLCIPIYNRLTFLERQLARMLEDKELFEEKIQLIVSDNCSTDDLQSCCEKYQKQGLNLTYHRNETNLGPDGNFDWCFHHADGKYVWLLGSDDIPVAGLFREMLLLLENSNYGLLHLSTIPRIDKFKVYRNDQTLLADINVWITFMSSNIIRTETVKVFDMSVFVGSYLIQVPAYLNACLSAEENAMVYLGKLFKEGSDAANNGGYNLFEVFVENLYGIYQSFMDKGVIPKESFEKVKRVEYEEFLVQYIIDFLILRKSRRKNFENNNSWSILKRHYGKYPYAYSILLNKLFNRLLDSLKYHLSSK